MGCAEVISLEEVRARKQWGTPDPPGFKCASSHAGHGAPQQPPGILVLGNRRRPAVVEALRSSPRSIPLA